MHVIDARGLACPQPVILTKQALDTEPEVVTLVDNETSVENLRRLATHLGCQVNVEPTDDGGFRLEFCRLSVPPDDSHKETVLAKPQTTAVSGERVYLIAQETLGQGDDKLGHILMKSFLYSLTEADPAPAQIILVNGGVKLAFHQETRESLQHLIQKGTEILGCGTCLDYFGLTDRFDLGAVTNMYTIVDILQKPGAISL